MVTVTSVRSGAMDPVMVVLSPGVMVVGDAEMEMVLLLSSRVMLKTFTLLSGLTSPSRVALAFMVYSPAATPFVSQV